MSSSRRTLRVGETVRQELSRLISRERSLEQEFVTITSVDMSPDLKEADVYITTLSQSESIDSLLRHLDNMRVDWQAELGRRCRLKYTPRLTFKYDEAIERGDRVMDIINTIDEEDEQHRKDAQSKD